MNMKFLSFFFSLRHLASTRDIYISLGVGNGFLVSFFFPFFFIVFIWFDSEFGFFFSYVIVFSVSQPDTATTVDAQTVEDPPSARFTWTIENFSRLNTKKLYSDVFYVGGYKWYLDRLHSLCLFCIFSGSPPCLGCLFFKFLLHAFVLAGEFLFFPRVTTWTICQCTWMLQIQQPCHTDGVDMLSSA